MNDDIIFNVLRDGKIASTTIIRNWSVRNCFHTILVPEHYNEDGSCKCRDKSDPNMPKDGYVWSDEERRWVSP